MDRTAPTCADDDDRLCRECLTAFTPWHLDAVSGSHPPIRSGGSIHRCAVVGAVQGEGARLRPRAGVILFAETKGGRPRHVYLTDPGTAFFLSRCEGRPISDPLFASAVRLSGVAILLRREGKGINLKKGVPAASRRAADNAQAGAGDLDADGDPATRPGMMHHRDLGSSS